MDTRIRHMDLLKIPLGSSEIYINRDSVCYVTHDPFNEKQTIVTLADGSIHKIKLSLKDTLNLLEYE